MKRLKSITLALTMTCFALPSSAKVTLDDVYKADEAQRAQDLADYAQYLAENSSPLKPRNGASTPENLEYVGSGITRLSKTGFYVIDANASGNRTTSSIFVPSLSGTYYGTSGSTSNSALGVKVVNGVLSGHGRVTTPTITAIYRLK
ncbi:hypothetical protein [Vibrio echinoideorum]|uniref:hypothetical protein n=1 Tax=Vibrio echinoideorum TaxID=2100116 RepID=UPI0035500901